MSMLGLVIILAFSTVVPGLKITKEAEESIAAQRQVILAFDRLLAEVSLLDRASASSAPGSLSYLSDKPYRGSNTAIDPLFLEDLETVSRDRTWAKHVVLRQRDGHLWRREYPYSGGGEIRRIAPAQLEVLADIQPIAEKIFAKNIESFETVSAGRSRIYLRIRSVYRENRKPVACQLTLQLQMRGGN